MLLDTVVNLSLVHTCRKNRKNRGFFRPRSSAIVAKSVNMTGAESQTVAYLIGSIGRIGIISI